MTATKAVKTGAKKSGSGSSMQTKEERAKSYVEYFTTLPLDQLKEMCTTQGVAAGGSKMDMVYRLADPTGLLRHRPARMEPQTSKPTAVPAATRTRSHSPALRSDNVSEAVVKKATPEAFRDMMGKKSSSPPKIPVNRRLSFSLALPSPAPAPVTKLEPQPEVLVEPPVELRKPLPRRGFFGLVLFFLILAVFGLGGLYVLGRYYPKELAAGRHTMETELQRTMVVAQQMWSMLKFGARAKFVYVRALLEDTLLRFL